MPHRRPFVIHDYPHTVYLLYSGRECLYVGMTKNPEHRLRAHRSKPWWPLVDRVETEEHPTRAAAMSREECYILLHKPTHNRVGDRWVNRRRKAGRRG